MSGQRSGLSLFILLVAVTTGWLATAAGVQQGALRTRADTHGSITTTGVACYAWPTSVAQGESVNIYVSTDAPLVAITIYRRGASLVRMARYDSLPAENQPIPESVWAVGCGWHVTKRIPVPDTWPSGVYVAECTAPPAGTYYAIFTVREDQPGSTASILFQNSITTWEAYNAWGGKSLYDYSSTGGSRSFIVSFQRPYDLFGGRGDFPAWEDPMVRFLEGNGYPVEYCTDIDIHANPALMENYDLVLSVGHDEYWSYQMRKAFQDRVNSGKNVAFFSGNICWWQIRVTPDRKKIICYKDKSLDPLYGIADSLVTVNWYDDPVFRPENWLTGTSFRNGGYVDAMGYYPHSEGYGDYTVYRSSSWVYAGTGLTDGMEFGWDDGIVGFEADGALFQVQGGLPWPTGTDGTPLNFTILGVSPASQGHATMGYYIAPSGGKVFNAATTDWAHGLWGRDPHVIQITRNVVESFAPHASSVASTGAGEGTDAGEVAFDVVPNPCPGAAVIRFSGAQGSHPEIAVYSVDGRLLSRLAALTGSAGAGEARWNGRDRWAIGSRGHVLRRP